MRTFSGIIQPLVSFIRLYILSGNAHAPRHQTLQHQAQNQRCSSSQLARSATGAGSRGLASDHSGNSTCIMRRGGVFKRARTMQRLGLDEKPMFRVSRFLNKRYLDIREILRSRGIFGFDFLENCRKSLRRGPFVKFCTGRGVNECRFYIVNTEFRFELVGGSPVSVFHLSSPGPC